MKILHIGDIHLGCTLDNMRRNNEIESVFRFLTGLVREKGIGAALIAGDVFDNGSPSNESQELYYDFLVGLLLAGCRQVVVIAGNHDNPNFLDATKGLLKRMNIHVIGNVDPENLQQEVISLEEADGSTAALVCAVPYLRERDVRIFTPEGEGGKDRKYAFQEGVLQHYRAVLKIAENVRKERSLPIIGMGHLYADGSSFATQKSRNPVGNLDAVDLDQCAAGFDYMALGHIHKPQKVAGHDHWRYAGSILPMNLRETMYAPQVILLDTENIAQVTDIQLPDSCFHKMCVIKGNIAELREQLNEIRKTGIPIWVKPVYTGNELLPNWAVDLRQDVRDSDIQIIEPDIQQNKTETAETGPVLEESLEQLTPEQIFLDDLVRKKEILPADQKEELLKLFRQAEAKVRDPEERKESPGKEPPAGILRFKRLYIKNLNSLYGENLIDFDDPEFKTGIFLISGNTGAGKSSILDAVSLALYGKTPRVEKVSVSEDSLMSEGTRELIAELTFSIGQTEYRAAFRHERTRNARDPYKRAEHTLYQDGRAVACKKTADEVTRLIGMNEKQFIRCVLLSQGNFDAFLKSQPAERSEILKSITGTEIYSRIGGEINAEFAAVKEQYTSELKALDAIRRIPDEELENLKSRQDVLKKTLIETDEKIKDAAVCEELFKNIENGKNALQTAEAALEKARTELTAAEPKRLELNDALRAQNCLPAFREFSEKQKEINIISENLDSLIKAFPSLEQEQSAAAENRKNMDSICAKLLQEQADSQNFFREVRSLETQIQDLKKHKAIAENEFVSIQNTQKKTDAVFQNEKCKWEKLQADSKNAEIYLKEHPGDKDLNRKKENWELRRLMLVEMEKNNALESTALKTFSQALGKTQKELKKNESESLILESKCKDLTEQLDETREKLKKLLNGKTRQEIQIVWAAAGKLNDFLKQDMPREELLHPDQPCPLCGSLQHPYCDGHAFPENPYEQKVNEFSQRLEAIDRTQAQIHELERDTGKRTAESLALKEKIRNRIQNLQIDTETFQTRSEQLKTALRKALETAEEIENELYISIQCKWPDHSALPEELDRRIQAYADNERKSGTLEKGKIEFESAEKTYRTLSEQNSLELEKRRKNLQSIVGELDELLQKHKQMTGDDPVDALEAALNRKVKSAQQKRELAVAASVKADSALKHNKDDQESLLKKRAEQMPELQNREKRFVSDLQLYGFKSTEEFHSLSRPLPQIQAMQQDLQKRDELVKLSSVAVEERRKNLLSFEQKIPAGITRESNFLKLEELQKTKNTIQTEFTSLEVRIHNELDARTRYKSAQEKIEQLRILFNHWDFLNRHLGSTPGANGTDRFGRIAQGYTFRKLLHFANANRLSSLRDHFTLVSDEMEPLELNVIDHYRGGLIRTSRNLSGGESFEVSLALALGLAEMSAMSQNARLGNVLLDEGFGTLDDQALESALELLMQLKNDGSKSIGIISHVSKLKERIETQIEVTSSNGMGMLSGAGVAHRSEAMERWAIDHPEEAAKRQRKTMKTLL